MISSGILDDGPRNSRNTQTLSHSACNLLRRSFGRLPFAFSSSSANNSSQLKSTAFDAGNKEKADTMRVHDNAESSRPNARGGLLQVSGQDKTPIKSVP